MKISEVLKEDRVKFSIEVFPPKVNSDYQKVEAAVERLCALQPDFMSVTYGAGGSTAQNTVKIASHVQNDLGVNALCHLTCVCADEASVTAQLDEMQEAMIHPLLMLRRYETLHCGLRWFDVKRFGIEIARRTLTSNDLGILSVDDELVVRDPRRAIQLPADVIAAGLTPNPR